MADDRLSETQLQRVVAEVEQLSERRQRELDREQVQEILQELNLPPELLEEAMLQLKRKDALIVQRQRNRQIMLGVGAALVITLGIAAFLLHQNQAAIGQVSAQQDRITLVQDDGGNLTNIARQTNAELFYRVTLKDAPVGKQLALTCQWLDPSGQIVHQNQYQTRPISTSIWTTHCRYQIGAATSPGTWQVKMFLQDRLMSDASFEVR